MRLFRDLVIVLLGITVPYWISSSIPEATIQRDAGAVVVGLLIAFAVVVFLENRHRFPAGDLRAPLRALDRELGRPRLVRTASPGAKSPRTEIEKGFLDFERDWQEALDRAPQFLEEINSETNFQTFQIERDTQRLLKARGAPIDKRLRVTGAIAKRIETDVGRLERLERAYRGACQQLAVNGRGLLKTTVSTTDLSPLLKTFSELRLSFSGARDATRGARATMQEGRKTNVSQDVNRAYDRQIGVLDKLVEDAENMVAFCDEARKILIARKPLPAVKGAKRG